ELRGRGRPAPAADADRGSGRGAPRRGLRRGRHRPHRQGRVHLCRGRPGVSDPRSVVVLGGTFDPVHLGHLAAAEQARDLAGADEAWLIPADHAPPRGAAMAAAGDRLAPPPARTEPGSSTSTPRRSAPPRCAAAPRPGWARTGWFPTRWPG